MSINKSPTLGSSQFISIAAIFGLLGAFFWAIRGTTGYGGAQGGLLAGTGWAVLWHYFSHIDGQGSKRPYASSRVIAAIILGIAFGGLTGYGVYIAWLQGKFYLTYPNDVREIAPWTGYIMLFLCGLHWGGNTGALMAWCSAEHIVSRTQWMTRIGMGIAGALLAWFIVRTFPHWFLPFYGEGIYGVPENATCLRAQGSIENISPHVGLFLGFLLFEALRGAWRNAGLMLLMAFGFAFPFAAGGYWHTLHDSGTPVDWWKNWEMSIGLGGGLSFGLAFYFFNRQKSEHACRPASHRELFWGGGVIPCLAGGLIFMSALKGVSSVHAWEFPVSMNIIASLVYVLLTSWWLYRWFNNLRANSKIHKVPSSILISLLLLIIISGYAVSIPVPLHPANKILLAFYSFYILSGLTLFLLMRTCLKQCQPKI